MMFIAYDKCQFHLGGPLQDETRERLIALAAQIAAEQDPEKFRVLLIDLNNLLEVKQRRLQQLGKSPEP